MGPTKQTEPTQIRLTYDEQTGQVTREPLGEFKVGELLEFSSGKDGQRVKVILHPKSAYEPNTYDETNPNQVPVRVVKPERGNVWCYFTEHGSHTPGVHTWSERYGFESDPGM
jgi:hypothetical protein